MAVDVSEELVQEMSDLRAIHVANFGEEQLHPIDLLNNLQKTKLQTLFPNCMELREFLYLIQHFNYQLHCTCMM